MKQILIYLLLFTTSLFAQVDTNLVAIKSYSIDSKSLNTKRNYWVSLPSSYNTNSTYPVMYILDAEWKYQLTNTIEKDLSGNGKIPPHIVVGIPCPNRRYNMSFSTSQVNCAGEVDTTAFTSTGTGNGANFLRFIEDELIKEIDHQFSTNGFNVMIGHSLGGYFCTYILPAQQSFQSLQIYDPSIWYSQGEAIEQIDNNLPQNKVCQVFISSSSQLENNCAYHYKKIEELNKSLKRFPNIKHRYKNYEDEHHNSMYLPSFLEGMHTLYTGYEIKKGKASINLSTLEEHFLNFSKTIQHEFKPTLDIYLEVGINNYHQKEYQKCIQVLEKYIKTNSANPYPLELIGDAHAIIGNKKESLKSYKKALRLSPENTRLQGKIRHSK